MSVTGSQPSIFEQICQWAHSAPQSTALAAPDRAPLTYARLWSQIGAVADTLAPCAERIVALSLPDGPDLALAILAASWKCLGAPINSKLPMPELRSCLSTLRPSAFIVEAGREQAIAVAEDLGIQVWELHSAPGSEAGVFEFSPHTSAKHSAGERAGPGLLLHTSATTGRPKLVPLTHANLLAQSFQTGGGLRLSNTDRFLSMMPLFHLQGAGVIFFQLHVGGCMICAPGFDAAQFLHWLAEFQPTWYTASPTMHRAILTLLDHGHHALPCRLRFVRSIGAPLAADLIASLETALRAPVIEGYGMTEAGAVTSNPLPPGHRKPGSVGTITGAEVGIFDASGQRLPPDSEGEIRLRGAAVTNGYWNDDAANAHSFCNGWLCTGDLGRFDHDGYLFVTGRKKEIVNRGGEKIMPHEIDHILATHPAVAEAAAFGVPHPTLGEDVAAAVVTRAGVSVTEPELREYIGSRLAAFKVPRRILFVERIPKGATGKPQRMLLREQHQTCCQPASVEGASELELKLVDIWRRILRTDIGLDDDFFVAGGDSLAATVMLAEVRTSVAVSPSLLEGVDFFENPTIRSLARLIVECGSTGEHPEPALLALQPNGFLPPLFLLPDATSEPYYFRGLAKHLGKEHPTLALRYGASAGELRTLEQIAANCITAIRSMQPRGPYQIGGHCFGGIVAFEIARQLIEAGEEIGLLALLDATTPGYPHAPAHWRRYARVLHRAFTRGSDSGVVMRDAIAHVRYLAARVRLVGGARWRQRMAATPLATVLPRVVNAPGANETAARSYNPRPLAVRALQFLATGERVDTLILDDPRLEWRRFASGGFETREVPGDHRSMFDEPNVRTLAGELQKALPQRDGRSEAPKALAAVGKQ